MPWNTSSQLLQLALKHILHIFKNGSKKQVIKTFEGHSRHCAVLLQCINCSKLPAGCGNLQVLMPEKRWYNSECGYYLEIKPTLISQMRLISGVVYIEGTVQIIWLVPRQHGGFPDGIYIVRWCRSSFEIRPWSVLFMVIIVKEY